MNATAYNYEEIKTRIEQDVVSSIEIEIEVTEDKVYGNARFDLRDSDYPELKDLGYHEGFEEIIDIVYNAMRQWITDHINQFRIGEITTEYNRQKNLTEFDVELDFLL